MYNLTSLISGTLPKLLLWAKIPSGRGLLEILVSRIICSEPTYEKIMKKNISLIGTVHALCGLVVYSNPSFLYSLFISEHTWAISAPILAHSIFDNRVILSSITFVFIRLSSTCISYLLRSGLQLPVIILVQCPALCKQASGQDGETGTINVIIANNSEIGETGA